MDLQNMSDSEVAEAAKLAISEVSERNKKKKHTFIFVMPYEWNLKLDAIASERGCTKAHIVRELIQPLIKKFDKESAA